MELGMNWPDVNWDIVFKALGIVVSAIVGATQIVGRLPKSRTTLKHDLEVLKLLPEEHQDRALIEAHIRSNIERIYAPAAGQPRKVLEVFAVHQWSDFIGGSLLALVATIVALYMIRDGWTWWAILPCFVALGGIGGVLEGLTEKVSSREHR